MRSTIEKSDRDSLTSDQDIKMGFDYNFGGSLNRIVLVIFFRNKKKSNNNKNESYYHDIIYCYNYLYI